MEKRIRVNSIYKSVSYELTKENNTIKDTIEEAVRSGVNLRYADLEGADLRGADLRCAKLHGANLRFANLENVILSDANLRCADLSCANLSGVHFNNACLIDADLSDACLCGTDLAGADLRGVFLRFAGKISKAEDILIVGNIGSRLGYTQIYNTDNGIFVKCGCFFGAIEEFAEKVKQTHGNNEHAKAYAALIDFAMVRFNISE